jgi:predicted MPP superfamily phosphohydrolase
MRRATARAAAKAERLRPAAALAAAAALIAAVLRALSEARRLAVRRRRLRLPGWPAGLDGLRLAVLSDLHAGAGHMGEDRLRAIVAATNRAQPHVVVLLGDFVDANAAPEEHGEARAVAGLLAGLRAPLGVFGLLGNHDRARHGPQTVAELERAGITVLENRALRAGGLWLAGISDAASAHPEPERALAGVPDAAPVVAITHSPDVFPMVPKRVALTLAGHTHAGQLNIPLLRRRLIPSRFGDRYRSGLIEEGGRRLFVHPGIGTSRIPVRLRATPEVTILELRRGPATHYPAR